MGSIHSSVTLPPSIVAVRTAADPGVEAHILPAGGRSELTTGTTAGLATAEARAVDVDVDVDAAATGLDADALGVVGAVRVAVLPPASDDATAVPQALSSSAAAVTRGTRRRGCMLTIFSTLAERRLRKSPERPIDKVSRR